MTLIPHFVQNELEAGDTAARASAFNFCNPFDTVLPIVDGVVSSVDRAQLWGMYSGISASTAPVFSGTISDISVTENTGTYNYDLSTYFTGATSYSISPTVEAGWTFNTATAELVIDTDDVNTFGPYTVTGTNAGGSDASNAFNVEVTAAVDEVATGGWWFAYDGELAQRKRKKKELERLEAKAEEIQDKIDRELAIELRAQDRELERIEELRRLSTLAEKHQKELKQVVSQKAIFATEQAIIKGTYSAMERMEREIAKAREEEQFLLYATSIILNS